MSIRIPTVALVGRPNVGKSTLFNRLVGFRQALVDDQPGVTRDRLFGLCKRGGKLLQVIDTGGLDSNPDDPLVDRMRQQTQLAVEQADVVLLLLDASDGLRPDDQDVVRWLHKTSSDTPVVGVVNKVDHPSHSESTPEFYALGLTLVEVSAEHGIGIEKLFDAIREHVELPEQEDVEREAGPVVVSSEEPEGPSGIEWAGGPIKVAVIGRPNVGKSSLVNKLLGEERLLASEIAGTTRDAIDTEFERDGQTYIFIDTAGIRRPRSISDHLERIAVMSARRSLERCDVAVILLDATTRPSDQDARIAAMAHELGKGIVLAANKWDLIENPEWRDKYPEAVRLDLDFVGYAPFVRLSAKTGMGLHKLLGPVVTAQQERHRRIGTGELNRFFKEAVEHHPPPFFKGKRAQLYFVSQPLVRPPTFIFTAKNPSNIPEAYSRYLRNQIRERYGFEGSPIWLKFRPRGRPKAAGSKGTRLDR